MSEKSFLRDNAVLLLGILLPVVLVSLIGISNHVAQSSVGDPEYALLYTRDNSYSNKGFDAVVKDGSLSVFYNRDNNNLNYRPSLTIFLYDYKTKTFRNYKYRAPDSQTEDRVEIEIDDALKTYAISDDKISPDGYSFETHYRRSSPFNIFGGGHGRAVIFKDGRRIKLPDGEHHYYNMEIIGWIKSGDVGGSNE